MASIIRDASCRGTNGYVCDASLLVDLLNHGEVDKSTQINFAVHRITTELDSIIQDVEEKRSGEVTNLYIGKAPITIKKKLKKGSSLQRMNPTTWEKSGIGSHWRGHKSKGRNGMIVLAAITRETTPNDIDQQEYALILQQKLIKNFKAGPNSQQRGGRQTKNPDGYVLYAAFSIDKNHDIDTNISTNVPSQIITSTDDIDMHTSSSFGFQFVDIHNEDDNESEPLNNENRPPIIEQPSTCTTSFSGDSNIHFTGYQNTDLCPPSQTAMTSATPSRNPFTPVEANPTAVLSTSIPPVPIVSCSQTTVSFTLPITGPPPSPPVTSDFPNNITASPSVTASQSILTAQHSPQQRQTSIISRTTVGGCTFDDLCRGAKNYACDSSCLVNLGAVSRTSETDAAVDEVVRLLAEKLEDNIRELEIARDVEVTKIYIGKTFIKQRRKIGGGFKQFDPMQPNTWKKNGISSRWGSHKRNKGKHGLIVLTAVTRKVVPKGVANQQRYALILEQKLIHHYEFRQDERLENKSSSEGAKTKNICYGYALYAAFTFEKNADDETTSGLPYINTIEDPLPTLSANAGSSNLQFTQPAHHVPVIVTPTCVRNAITQTIS